MTGATEHADDRTINVRKLWSGGGVVAIVAGLVAIAGALVATGLVHVLLLATPRPTRRRAHREHTPARRMTDVAAIVHNGQRRSRRARTASPRALVLLGGR